MNENEDGIFNTLTILSDNSAVSHDTGALIVKGGANIYDNLVTRSIKCDFIQVDKRIKLCGDIFINDCMLVNNNIIPVDGSCEIGSYDKRWGNIYSNNIDSNNAYFNNEVHSTNGQFNYIYGKNDVFLGEIEGNYMFKLDFCNSLIKIDVNNTIICGTNNKLVEFSQQSNTTTFYGNIAKSYKVLDITEDLENIICDSHIIFINILANKELPLSTFINDSIMISCGTIVRLIVKHSDDKTLNLLEDDGYKLYNKTEWIELIFNGNNWDYIGGNI